jgi:N-acetylglutamate synthase-like GNAT family acetyltransferase
MTARSLDQEPTTAPRPLSISDLTACLTLADNREWPHEDRKWELLLRAGQGYGIDDAAGKLAASAVLTRFDGVAAISMVLVAAHYERRGLGARILRHAMAEAGDDITTLYATTFGKPLYERLGFVGTSAVEVAIGRFTGTATGTTRPATAADLPDILRLDTEVLGADRTAVLSRLPDYAERIRVIDRDGVITGYAAASRPMTTGDYTQIGPVIAAEAHDARALIADLAAETDGKTRVDLEDHSDLAAWATAHGLDILNTCTFMVVGGTALPGDRKRMFVPLLQALG